MIIIFNIIGTNIHNIIGYIIPKNNNIYLFHFFSWYLYNAGLIYIYINIIINGNVYINDVNNDIFIYVINASVILVNIILFFSFNIGFIYIDINFSLFIINTIHVLI